jgi:hypothetical protein
MNPVTAALCSLVPAHSFLEAQVLRTQGERLLTHAGRGHTFAYESKEEMSQRNKYNKGKSELRTQHTG